jgi:hypothetical protein
MPDYDHIPAPENNGHDDESDVFITPEQARLQRVNGGILRELSESSPDLFTALEDGLHDLDHISEKVGLLRLYQQYIAEKFILERAAYGLPASKTINERLRRGLYPDVVLDASFSINNALQDIATRGLPPKHPPAILLEFLRNRKQSIKMATKYTRNFSKAIEENNISDTFESDVLSSYIATLLSGDASAYERLADACRAGFQQIKQRDPSESTLQGYITEQPEQLHELANELGSDTETAFTNHMHIYLLMAVGYSTYQPFTRDQLNKYRATLLDFAANITFNEQAVLAILSALQNVYNEISAEQSPKMQPMELDWEVLPPGQLTEQAKTVVASSQRTKRNPPRIDLSRLTILENIRTWVGEDKCYYAKGVRTGRHKVRDDMGNEQPDEYIMLVIQTHDDSGTVMYEDVVAESPIAGSNALYVQRYEVNGWAWRELMAYPKTDVLSMGARRLKHEAPKGEDLTHNMVEKVKSLLTCSPEDFTRLEFKGVQKGGALRTRLARAALGQVVSEPSNPSMLMQTNHQDHQHETDGDL